MHVVAVKPELLDAHPEVAMRLFDAFERAKEIAFHYYDDPNWGHLAWAVHLLQEERQSMAPRAWANSLGRNRKNLERILQYELDQGLIDRRLEVEDLFSETTHCT
jgi:4,5-dihydroxyphthalate decarboxylase